MARLLFRLTGPGPKLLWIRETGVWPSLENWDLFDALRRSSGEQRRFGEAPAHLFDADEEDRAVSMIQVVLLSGWGAALVGLESRQRIAISHDSWFYVTPTAFMQEQLAQVERVGLPYRFEHETAPATALLDPQD